MAKIIDETQEYVTVEFDDSDLHEDRDIEMMNRCTIRGINFEFIDEDETVLKIYRKGGN